jgi:predicted TPR repeat methyltransferase
MKSPAESYYDDLAHSYDYLTQEPGAWNAPRRLAAMAKEFSPLGETLVVGIGTGQDIPFLLENGATVVNGVDISTNMLRKCREKYPEIFTLHGEFTTFNALPRDFYDSIVCSGVSEFMSNIRLFFQKCDSVTKPGAKIFFTFEPFIENHKIQSFQESVVENTASGLKSPNGFMTYRRSLLGVTQDAMENGFSVLYQMEYVAYRKADVDIIYHALVFIKTKTGTPTI